MTSSLASGSAEASGIDPEPRLRISLCAGAPQGPSEAMQALAEAISKAEPKAASECFARSATICTPDGTQVEGRGGVRAILAQLVAMPVAIEAAFGNFTRGGDIAIGQGTWKVRSIGKPSFEQTWGLVLVFARLEGVWKISIALPWDRGPAPWPPRQSRR